MKYIKTFSAREITTCLLSATMIMALFAVYYTFLFETHSNTLKIAYVTISLLIPIAASHRLYLLEHRRPNSFWGRLINNAILSLFLMAFSIIFMKITNSFYMVGYYSNAVFLVLLLVYVSEILLSLINSLFKVLKWRIW